MSDQLTNRLFWVLAGICLIALIAIQTISMSDVDHELDNWVSQSMTNHGDDSPAVKPARNTAIKSIRRSGIGADRVSQGDSGLRDQVAADRLMKLFLIFGAEGQTYQHPALGAALLQ